MPPRVTSITHSLFAGLQLIMPGEVAWSFRAAAACEVGGTGADHEPDGPYLPRDHAAVRQGADPDPEIDVLFLQIHHSVR